MLVKSVNICCIYISSCDYANTWPVFSELPWVEMRAHIGHFVVSAGLVLTSLGRETMWDFWRMASGKKSRIIDFRVSLYPSVWGKGKGCYTDRSFSDWPCKEDWLDAGDSTDLIAVVEFQKAWGVKGSIGHVDCLLSKVKVSGWLRTS